MRILVIAQVEGTSRHRIEAMRRLGHEVKVIDPRPDWLRGNLARRFLFQTSGLGVQNALHSVVNVDLKEFAPDVVWVNQGEYLGPRVIRSLKRLGVPVIAYVNDDPFAGGVRSRRFRSFRSALKLYDLIAAVRDVNIDEFVRAGASKVVRVRMSADEIYHAPPSDKAGAKALSSEVAFIGTWFPERGPLLARLVELGVPLSIWGGNWQKAPEWPALSRFHRGEHLDSNGGYRDAVYGARICLGLLSKENRDTHTTRSIEIPYIGSVLCGERTAEHLDMYLDRTEAIFWDTPEECAIECLEALADPERLEAIRLAGQRRAASSGYLNEDVVRSILNAAL